MTKLPTRYLVIAAGVLAVGLAAWWLWSRRENRPITRVDLGDGAFTYH